jgi:hypothetical protein
MIETMKELQEQLQALPEPNDNKLTKEFALLKRTGKLLATLLTIKFSPQEREVIMTQHIKNASILASSLGSNNEGVQIVMKMIELINAQENK